MTAEERMNHMKTLGVVGAGNMATAISRGILTGGSLAPADLMIYDVSPEKLAPFAKQGLAIASSEAEVARECRYVLLAVKPQVYREVLAAIAPACGEHNVFVSIAAGISGDFIKRALGRDAKIVLVMPNTPLLVGCGASALSRVEPTTREEFDEVLSLFSASGMAVEIQPNQMNEIIPVNGSSPALFYRLAQIFVGRAAALGFSSETANQLFCQAMIGSARMMLETGKGHQELIDMVCSKGGTTLAMLDAMEKNGLGTAMLAGIESCVRRADELGQ